jgi:hypothetical protein
LRDRTPNLSLFLSVEERKMESILVEKIRQKISEIKSENVKSISEDQLDLLLKTNASKEALEDFLGDVTFVVMFQ